jgi:hypothetical protein
MSTTRAAPRVAPGRPASSALPLLLLVAASGCASAPPPRAAWGPVPREPPPGELDAVLKSAEETIHGCANGELQGTLHATVVFGPTGLVRSVELTRWQTPPDEHAMRACMIHALEQLRVGPFQNDSATAHARFRVY